MTPRQHLVHWLVEGEKEIREDWVCWVCGMISISLIFWQNLRYCYGGATCVRIGSTGLVDTVVIAHPGTFSLDQVKAMKVPASWVCAQGISSCQLCYLFWSSIDIISEDFFFPDSLRHQAEAEFAGRKGKQNFVEYEFKEWKGKWLSNISSLFLIHRTNLCSHRHTTWFCLTSESESSGNQRSLRGSVGSNGWMV